MYKRDIRGIFGNPTSIREGKITTSMGTEILINVPIYLDLYSIFFRMFNVIGNDAIERRSILSLIYYKSYQLNYI